MFVEPSVAPMPAHLGVNEILVDGRQVPGEDLVQEIDHLRVSLHGRAPFPLCEEHGLAPRW